MIIDLREDKKTGAKMLHKNPYKSTCDPCRANSMLPPANEHHYIPIHLHWIQIIISSPLYLSAWFTSILWNEKKKKLFFFLPISSEFGWWTQDHKSSNNPTHHFRFFARCLSFFLIIVLKLNKMVTVFFFSFHFFFRIFPIPHFVHTFCLKQRSYFLHFFLLHV